jgi:hypothetical protein
MARLLLALTVVAMTAVLVRAQDNPTYSVPGADGAPAQKGPDLVNPAAIQTQSDQLHDAVAAPATQDGDLRFGAARLFESVQSETPLFRPAPMPIARERVDGHVGTIDGMVQEAQQRWDHYKMHATEVPNVDLDASIAFGKRLRNAKRMDFDKTGAMPENQMGVFHYAKDTLTGGIVEMNNRMALIATRLGEAFSYSTLVHEATHAKAREAGRLDPKAVIDGEVEAYRAQYYWIKSLDPKAERMAVLHSTLTLWLKHHPEDKVSQMSLTYLEHLITVFDTDGEDSKIKKMIKDLGYHDGDDDHDGGVAPNSAPVRA